MRKDIRMGNLRAAASALALASLPFLAPPAGADAGPRFRDGESQAMGRTGVASSAGAPALFLNPAALGRAQGFGAGMMADVGLNSVLLEYADWAKDNYQWLSDFDSLVTRIGPVDNKWAPFSNSAMLYGNWGGTAVAFLMDTRYELTVAKAVGTPVLGVGAHSDLAAAAGRAFTIPEGDFRLGMAFKYLYRLRYDSRLVGTGDDDFYKAKHTLERENDGFFGTPAKIQAAGDLAETQEGFGFDLGIEKDIAGAWAAGVSLLNFPTVLDGRFTRPDPMVGVAWHPAIDWLPDLDDHLVVNLDWQHALSPATPWSKQIKAGAAFEGRVRGRAVSYIALGVNDGYPTFGFRAGYFVYLSYLYVAEEAGTYPGQQKLSFHKLMLQAEY